MKTIYKIKKIRDEKRFSQEEMAAYIGIEQNTYSRIESGKSKIKFEHALLIAQKLDIPITELIDEEQFSVHIEDNKVETGANQFIQNIVHTINVEQKELIEYLKELITKKENVLTLQTEQITTLIKLLERK